MELFYVSLKYHFWNMNSSPPKKKPTQKPNNNNNKTSKEPLPDVVNNNIADVRFILFYNLFFLILKGAFW